MTRKLRILVVKANDGGCAYYRAILPFEKLQEHYPDKVEIRIEQNPLGIDPATQQWIPNFDFADMKWADVVVINNISNYGGPYTARVAGKAKEFGKYLHVDNDDLLTNLYDEHRLKDVYENRGLSEIASFIYNHAHLVTVTQRKFAERIKQYCTGILAVVKNAIDYNLSCWNETKPKRKTIHIGWAGGIHHDPDVREFAAVPSLVNQKVGREKVFWDFYGHPPPPKPGQPKDWQWDVWEGYRKTLLKGFKGPANWKIHFAMPPGNYGVMYANMDLAIAPLQMNDFNDSKSDIKVAEAGRYAVPLVASNVGCYDETIINWETGVLIPPDASRMVWAKTLTKLIKNPKLVKQMGENLKTITDEYFDINKVVGMRLELYEEAFKSLGWDPRSGPKTEDVFDDKDS